MEVQSCRSCGRLFNYLQGPPICPACKQKMEEKFVVVKEYIRNNAGASLQQIADENEVSIRQLKQWVREERLTFTDDSPVGIECENCGATIKTGRFCAKCKEKLSSNLKEMYKAPHVETKNLHKEKDRMRYLDT